MILVYVVYTFLFLVSIVILVHALSSLIAEFAGAPFVPTSGKNIDEILKRANLREGQVFMELGSGDGRVVRAAVKNYGVYGTGVELQPLLILYCKVLAKFQRLDHVRYVTGSFFKMDFSTIDVIFMFLLPRTVKKLSGKIMKECKRGTLVISHGFKVVGMEKRLVDRINTSPFPTYFYRV